MPFVAPYLKKHLKTARFLTRLMDNQFSFLGIQFGLDPIIGLYPVLGDLIGVLLSSYLVVIALELKLPTFKIFQMILNILIDFLMGVIPILGDLFDLGFKVNVRNLKLIEDHVQKSYQP